MQAATAGLSIAIVLCLAAPGLAPSIASEDIFANRPAFSEAEQPVRMPAECRDVRRMAEGIPELDYRIDLSVVGMFFAGVAYVVTENRALPYENMQVALGLSAPIGGIFSIRSLVALAIFAAAALVIGLTRYGRDIIAIGSDRRGAMTAGVNVNVLVIGIFGFSGFCAALSGALLSYSLASASPAGLSDVIVPAAAAAILGGVSLAGGTGRPLGIAVGVLSLAVLRAGFNAVGAPPYVNGVAMGAILLIVAVLDGPYLARRLHWLVRRRAH